MNTTFLRRAAFTPAELSALEALSHLFPSAAAASVEIACLRALLRLPKGTVHIVTDVHGEGKKLQHVLNNASGSIRPLVEEVFAQRLGAEEKQQLLNVIYYPRQMFEYLGVADSAADADSHAEFVQRTLRRQFAVLVALSRRFTLRQLEQAFPATYRPVFRELFWEAQGGRTIGYIDAMLRSLCEEGTGLDAVHWASRAIRYLSVSEVVVAGDVGDRGARLDKVMDILMRQPRVAVTWGNHDVSWMGASLGHEALIATVLRVSLRYSRVAQLEEGFGISLQPLEKLVRSVYAADPASRFDVRGECLRESSLMRRMQKAVAILQFKLEAQVIARHPEYRMQHRALIERIDLQAGKVVLDGRAYPLTDTAFPTLDPHRPSILSAEEESCIALLKKSFLESEPLRRQMMFLARHGSSYLIRDGHLIFHGCVPVDEDGGFLSMAIDGAPRAGRALFDALDAVVHRAFRDRVPEDADLLWYLWTGPLSPMFGKDKMSTFETYYIADEATHREAKNSYYRLIDGSEFCKRVLQEFGVELERGLIVNGHVRLKEGEEPLKESGQAIAIDGGFSESYGDRGYTLILDSAGTHLAEHHHFESVVEALTRGADIIPQMRPIRRFSTPRLVADTENGDLMQNRIFMLERLISAYREDALRERHQQDVTVRGWSVDARSAGEGARC